MMLLCLLLPPAQPTIVSASGKWQVESEKAKKLFLADVSLTSTDQTTRRPYQRPDLLTGWDAGIGHRQSEWHSYSS